MPRSGSPSESGSPSHTNKPSPQGGGSPESSKDNGDKNNNPADGVAPSSGKDGNKLRDNTNGGRSEDESDVDDDEYQDARGPEGFNPPKILPEPHTSPRDPNHYRLLELDNGFKVVLISNLGYASDEARRIVLENDKARQKCEDQVDTSVFNRRRSRRGEKKDSEEVELKARRRANSMNNLKCIDNEVKKFDRDMNETGIRIMLDSKKSILEEVAKFRAEERSDDELMEVDEPELGKTASTAKPFKESDESDNSDEDDVFEDASTSSVHESGKSPTDSKSSVSIKSKWGPQPETDDEELLEEERKIMQRKVPEVEIALTFAVGSMHDNMEVPGLSHLAHEAVVHALKGKDILPYHLFWSKEFNSAEYTTIRLTTKVESLKSQLKHIANSIARLSVGKRHVLHDIDEIDHIQEDIQCNRCWNHPMTDERRLAILGLLAKDGHPVKTISSGHPPKLWTAGDAHNNDLEQRIFEFITTHYIGSNGTLAIEASETLDNLEEAITVFNSLGSGPKAELIADSQPFSTDEFKMFYKVYCSNPKCSDLGDAYIVIAWPLPAEYWKNHATKPLQYLGALISDQSSGGLLHYLRETNLAWDLSAGCSHASNGYHRNKFASLFEIQVTLNENGFASIDELIRIIFSYLKFLKINGPSKSFFKDQQKLRSAQFHALGQEITVDEPYPITISKLSSSLQLYEPRDILTAPIILRKYDEKVIQECIELLVPGTCNYMLCLCEEYFPPSEPVRTEEIFHTKFTATEISPERLKKWNEVTALPDFKFPGPNPFIHDNDCLLELEEDSGSFNLFEPEPGSEFLEFYRIWYQQDRNEDHFAIYFIHVISPVSYACVENAVMLQIWYLLLKDLLHPLLGGARAAGIKYNLKPTHHGLLIAVFSWNNKVALVVNMILREIAAFGNKFSQDSFNKKKKGYLKHLAGLIKDEYLSNPNLARDLYASILHVNRWSLPEMYNELLGIRMKDFEEFMSNFKRKFSIAALLRGNVNRSKAEELETLMELTFIPNYGIKQFHVKQNLLPKHVRILSFNTLSDWTTDNHVLNSYQIGITCIKDRVCADLFYMAFIDFLNKYDGKGGKIGVKKTKSKAKSKSRQSEPEMYGIDVDMQEVQGIVTLFLESYGNQADFSLEKLDKRSDTLLKECFESEFNSENDFKSLKNQLRERNYRDAERGHWSGDESYFYDDSGVYGAIEDLTYRFTEIYCKIDALKLLSFNDMIDFYERCLIPNFCEFRKLSVQIHGKDAKDLPEPVELPKTFEEWRLRRKNFRECTSMFNDHYHKLIHSHKKGKAEKFHIQFHDDVDGKCSNALFITDTAAFKRGLFQFPTKLCKD